MSNKNLIVKYLIFLLYLFIIVLTFSFSKTLDSENEYVSYQRKMYFTIQSFQSEQSFLRYLNFIKKYNITGITFYGFHNKITTDPKIILLRLRQEIYNLEICIAGENFEFFNNLVQNQEILDLIDGFHIEYEYWNYYKYKKKDRNDAFNFFISESRKIKELAISKNKMTEAYFGWFTNEEFNIFKSFFDLILIHAYTKKEEDVPKYIFERLNIIKNSQIPFYILCSAEKDFMEERIKLDGIKKIEKNILENISFILSKDYMKNFKGFYWFTGELIEKIVR